MLVPNSLSLCISYAHFLKEHLWCNLHAVVTVFSLHGFLLAFEYPATDATVTVACEKRH